jgi:hypothetical protein
MASVQISPNSVLSNPADVNPLAYPSYQHPIQKIKEQNNKAIEQIKTDTVTISQEAIAKSLALNPLDLTSTNNTASQVTRSSQITQPQFITKSNATTASDASLSIDEVTISSEALIKSTLLKALSDAVKKSQPETAYEMLRL